MQSTNSPDLSQLATTSTATIGIVIAVLGFPLLWVSRLLFREANTLGSTFTAADIAAVVSLPIWISLIAALAVAGRPLRHSAWLPASWQSTFRQWVEASAFGAGAMVRGWSVQNPEASLSAITIPAPATSLTDSPTTATPLPERGPDPKAAVTPDAPAATKAAVVPKSMREYIVVRGDNFRSLAQRFLGDGDRWGELLEANVGREVAPGVHLGQDTRLLKNGWRIVVPAAPVTEEGVSS